MLSSINSNFTGFQSSPSIQRETTKGAYADDFYVISILSLYAEGDVVSCPFLPVPFLFQSSPSIQRETELTEPTMISRFISILSLYTEGDVNNYKRWF